MIHSSCVTGLCNASSIDLSTRLITTGAELALSTRFGREQLQRVSFDQHILHLKQSHLGDFGVGDIHHLDTL